MGHGRGLFGLSAVICVIRANMHRENKGFTAILCARTGLSATAHVPPRLVYLFTNRTAGWAGGFTQTDTE